MLNAYLTMTVQVLSPLISAGSLLFAVWRANAVLGDWRAQKQLEKRAEIASKGLLVAMQFISQLTIVVGELAHSMGSQPNVQVFHSRWQSMGEVKGSFQESIMLARVHLSDEAADSLEDILKQHAVIWAAQMLWMAGRGDSSRAVWGDQAVSELRLDTRLEKARALLQPYIRMIQSA